MTHTPHIAVIHTPSLLIVTADDFPIYENVDQACQRLVKDAGCGRHQYGGKHYPGHHVVFQKWRFRGWSSSRPGSRRSALKLHNAINSLHPRP